MFEDAQSSNDLRGKLQYLSVQREVVEDHGADEGDLRGLRVHDLLLGVHPQTGQLGEDVDHLQQKITRLHIHFMFFYLLKFVFKKMTA